MSGGLDKCAFSSSQIAYKGRSRRAWPYHPNILGFDSALKEFRKKSSDDVVSTTRVPLPFPVQASIVSKSSLGWKCSDSMVFYADLKATVDDYAVVNDDDAFEKV